MASATAVRDARAGLRVLIVSTDQAHSIGDVLGASVTPTGLREPTRVLADLDTGRDARPGGFLEALALDTLALLESRWREIAGLLSRRFPESDLGGIAPEELSALPGIQEVLCLHEVGELARSGEWDHVVVDCASTADALRMLTLPATFGLYLERAWPRHRRLSSASDDARVRTTAPSTMPGIPAMTSIRQAGHSTCDSRRSPTSEDATMRMVENRMINVEMALTSGEMPRRIMV